MLNWIYNNSYYIMWMFCSLVLLFMFFHFDRKRTSAYKIHKKQLSEIKQEDVLKIILNTENLQKVSRDKMKKKLSKLYKSYNDSKSSIQKFYGSIIALQSVFIPFYTFLISNKLVEATIFSIFIILVIVYIMIEIMSLHFKTLTNSIVYIRCIEKYMDDNVLDFALHGIFKHMNKSIVLYKSLLISYTFFLIIISLFVFDKESSSVVSAFGFLQAYIVILALSYSETKRYRSFLISKDDSDTLSII